jgi:release factor glutamine methyltransferase
VALQTYAEFLKSYFTAERSKLFKNYPGLTLHRLTSESPIKNLDDLYLPAESHPFKHFIDKINHGIPLEYISGHAYFFRSNFVVNENVLIPRNETEILVELAIQEIQRSFKNRPCRVLDICTGSGAIGLSVLREGGADFDLTLSDLSSLALDIAKKNYFEMQYLFSPKHKIQFIESDRFAKIVGQFDFILSNPPYIKETSDRNLVHDQVVKFEPALALFITDNEYEKWFSNFLQDTSNHLVDGGVAIIEGHEIHLEDIKNIATQIGFNKIDIIKDYNQCNRFLRLVK